MEPTAPTQDQASDTGPRPVSELLRPHRLGRALTDSELAELDRDAETRERSRRMAALLAEAGKAYKSRTFDAWVADTDKQRAVKSAVERWAGEFPERQRSLRHGPEGLVLYGPVGTGKDHLAFAAVALAVLRHGLTARWENGRDLMGEARDRIGDDRPERTLLSGLTAADILVISDPLPPIGELTVYQADLLYRIVESRSAAGRVTVCTLNVASDDEADRRLGAPTWDRLCGGAWKLACFWESHRKPVLEIKP